MIRKRTEFYSLIVMQAEEKDWGHLAKTMKDGKFELNNKDESLHIEVGKKGNNDGHMKQQS